MIARRAFFGLLGVTPLLAVKPPTATPAPPDNWEADFAFLENYRLSSEAERIQGQGGKDAPLVEDCGGYTCECGYCMRFEKRFRYSVPSARERNLAKERPSGSR
jgi:hypothetical protein